MSNPPLTAAPALTVTKFWLHEAALGRPAGARCELADSTQVVVSALIRNAGTADQFASLCDRELADANDEVVSAVHDMDASSPRCAGWDVSYEAALDAADAQWDRMHGEAA